MLQLFLYFSLQFLVNIYQIAIRVQFFIELHLAFLKYFTSFISINYPFRELVFLFLHSLLYFLLFYSQNIILIHRIHLFFYLTTHKVFLFLLCNSLPFLSVVLLNLLNCSLRVIIKNMNFVILCKSIHYYSFNSHYCTSLLVFMLPKYINKVNSL